MAFKQFKLDSIGPVTVYKRRGARSIRLSVDHAGVVKVTIPTWVPYVAGVNFAKTKQAWLALQLAERQQPVLVPGGTIGKQHRLEFIQQDTTKPRSRLGKDYLVTVVHGRDQAWDSPDVQTAARRGAARALRSEAESLLPARLRSIAQMHGFEYNSVRIKQLKSRWGSCDQDKNVVLNLFLMQLPWHLVDYVLLHELTHTKVMQHGPKFWSAMTVIEPRTQEYRKEIRTYRTILEH